MVKIKSSSGTTKVKQHEHVVFSTSSVQEFLMVSSSWYFLHINIHIGEDSTQLLKNIVKDREIDQDKLKLTNTNQLSGKFSKTMKIIIDILAKQNMVLDMVLE